MAKWLLLFLALVTLQAVPFETAVAQDASVSADRDWYVSLKRIAKYGRIVHKAGNSARLADERAAAYGAVVSADRLAEPYRAMCKEAARALVEAIESYESRWPEKGETPFGRAERMGDKCLSAINRR